MSDTIIKGTGRDAAVRHTFADMVCRAVPVLDRYTTDLYWDAISLTESSKMWVNEFRDRDTIELWYIVRSWGTHICGTWRDACRVVDTFDDVRLVCLYRVERVADEWSVTVDELDAADLPAAV